MSKNRKGLVFLHRHFIDFRKSNKWFSDDCRTANGFITANG